MAFNEGTVSADNGREEPEGGKALIDAWAVFTDTEAVGGPDRKMERLGVLKREGCVELPTSRSGAVRAGILEDVRYGKFVAGPP